MQIRIRYLRTIALILLLAYLQMVFFPISGFAQTPNCGYDVKSPSLEHARKNFKGLNYRCAEMEINDLLKLPELSLEDKSNAHILLAAVYYAMLKDDSEKRSKVMQQFKAAFKAYREWRGELDIKSPEFVEMMKEAQLQVDTEATATTEPGKPAEDTTKAKPAPPVIAETKAAKTGGKAWYKQWWAIGLGVGVVAGAVVLLSGGGGETTQPPLDTLPTFPNPPSKR
jgi:hypothetical protein